MRTVTIAKRRMPGVRRRRAAARLRDRVFRVGRIYLDLAARAALRYNQGERDDPHLNISVSDGQCEHVAWAGGTCSAWQVPG